MAAADIIMIPADESLHVRKDQVAEPGLPTWQRLVGGNIELVRMDDAWGALCNEDGYSMGLKPNSRASELLGQPMIGDVVLVGVKNAEFVSIPSNVWNMARNL